VPTSGQDGKSIGYQQRFKSTWVSVFDGRVVFLSVCLFMLLFSSLDLKFYCISQCNAKRGRETPEQAK